jgi:uncharacterized protein (TIGR02246 family)
MDGISEVERRYTVAVFDKDVEGFLAIYDEDAIVFDLWGERHYQGRAAWRQSVAAWFGSLGDERVQVIFLRLACTIESDLAFWLGNVNFAALSPSGEILRSMRNRLTWQLRRRDDAWSIVHEHTSAPADHETLKVILNSPA